MAECKSATDTYLNYKCYKFLKPRFDQIKLGDSIQEYFNTIYGKFEKENQRHSWYRPLFFELVSHITKDHIFIKYDRLMPCNFVNYLLNYKLRNTKYQYDNISHYDIYKKFLRDFYKERFGRYDSNKSCDFYIKYIKEDIFKRMANLYQLYDDYNGLEKLKEKVDSKECDKLSMLASFFNEISRTHGKEDNEIHKRLKELKNIIEEEISSPYDTCNTKINFFHLPQPSSPVQIIRAPALPQVNVHPDPALKVHGAQQNLQETGILKEDPPEKRETVVRGDLSTSRNSEHSEELTSIKVSHHSPGSVSLNTWESEKETRIYGSGTSHLLGTFHGLAPPYAQIPEEPYPVMEEENGNTEGGIQQPDYRGSKASPKEGGVSGILSSIGGVLGEVDPAPVLGVSGGMGVLFLLFKYTPVGSFFGGRRRRFRQIPSSFRGYPPGEFPNFQEYESGYIGYGPMNINPLAE